MNILFDQGVPVPLREHLTGHSVSTAFERNWSTLTNGELLDAAEGAGYHVMITTDQNLKSQQNLDERTIAVVVLLSTSWPRIRHRVDAIREAIEKAHPGECLDVPI